MTTKLNFGVSAVLAKSVAVLGIAGLLGGVVVTAPAQADPPRKIFGVRTDRNHHDNDHKDRNHHDSRDHRDKDHKDYNRNDRSRLSDRDHDGTPDRYDRYPNDRRRH